MPNIFVAWYDNYGYSHNSQVYFVDSDMERFFVVDESRNFRWVSTSDCELLNNRLIVGTKKENGND